MKRILHSGAGLLLLFICMPFLTIAQELPDYPTQVVRGSITNNQTREVESDVVIELVLESDTLQTVSDVLGRFRFEEVPVGRCHIWFTKLGLAKKQISELYIQSGKEMVLEVLMVPQPSELQLITISVDSLMLVEPVAPGFAITPEMVKRFPSNFFDPGRFVTHFPGVINDNDQGNSISVRGTSPAFFKWRLEEIEIVNPNHTSNAGTFGDRSTPGAGGVNMLSTEATAFSRLYRGLDTDVRFSNTLGGILDMNIRHGNDEKFEKMVRVGLLGLEAAVEGPISSESDDSYLVHYRYSFTGLLGALGVDFGGEDIRFQDLNFNLNMPTNRFGNFSLFGVGGTSANYFTGDPTATETPLEKDYQNIDFRSRTGILGLKHVSKFGTSGAWNTRVGISALGSERNASTPADTLTTLFFDADTLATRKLFASSNITWTDQDDDFFKVGLSYLQRASSGVSEIDRLRDDSPVYQLRSSYVEQLNLLRAFGEWTKTFGTQWECMLGFNIAYFAEGQEFNPELRLYVDYKTKDGKHRWKAGYQAFSQLPPAVASAVFGESPQEQAFFSLMKSESISLNYYLQLPNANQFFASAYHNLYYNLPQSVDPKFGFSAFNQLEAYRVSSSTVNDEGEGRTFGLEAGLSKNIFFENWYYLVSGSVFRSYYTNAKGTEFPSQFDRKFSFTGTLGREWTKELGDARTRTLGVSIRPILTGGLRIAPIDESASAASGITIFDYSDGYTDNLPAYFRTDFQVNATWNKPGVSQRLSLAIQNVTNQQNIAFYYYDQIQGEVVARYQLGLVPVLSYRLSF
ncbi:MAG: TonB-dependent receptor [Bacteroidetes bacterium]|nr:TonB-dependent receptor [Bacteroidota bacterium]